MHIINRDIHINIERLLANFPIVVILGARQVGKSTSLKSLLPDAAFFDLEKNSDYRRASEDPELIFREVETPIIFDEAQLVPALFSALRIEIDRQRHVSGQFLISGSSSPQLLTHISETLAGRCAIVELSNFSWNEIAGKPESRLYDSLNDIEQLKKLTPIHTHKQLLEYCIKGGYPEPSLKNANKLFFEQWMEAYIKTYIERDIRRLFPTLNFDAYQRFIKMLCFASGEMINLSNFSRSLGVSQPTIKKYMDIMEGTFMWRSLMSYSKNQNKNVTKMSKGHIRDSGLICHMLNIDNVSDLKSHPKYGQIWESFITEQLLKSLQNKLIIHQHYYYRTRSQAEIDLVLEGRFGLLPIEIKAAYSTSKKQIISLQKFVNDNECKLGIVINSGDEIFLISDNIIQIPAQFL